MLGPMINFREIERRHGLHRMSSTEGPEPTHRRGQGLVRLPLKYRWSKGLSSIPQLKHFHGSVHLTRLVWNINNTGLTKIFINRRIIISFILWCATLVVAKIKSNKTGFNGIKTQNCVVVITLHKCQVPIFLLPVHPYKMETMLLYCVLTREKIQFKPGLTWL